MNLICFTGVIRNSHADATDDEISTPIKIWLAHAKERAAKEKSQQKIFEILHVIFEVPIIIT